MPAKMARTRSTAPSPCAARAATTVRKSKTTWVSSRRASAATTAADHFYDAGRPRFLSSCGLKRSHNRKGGTARKKMSPMRIAVTGCADVGSAVGGGGAGGDGGDGG